MSDQTDDVVYQIAQTTARTEERARNIERDVKELKLRYSEDLALTDERIGNLERVSERHGLILGGGLAAIGASLSAFFSWTFGWIRF